MSGDRKQSVKNAMEAYSKRTDPNKVKRTNTSPEKDFVHDVLAPHLRSIGCSINIIESKATYSEKAKRYTMQSVAPGYPDLSGNFNNGLALYIEAKAPGSRKLISAEQFDFLVSKINTNAFAACVDSIDYFSQLLKEYKESDNKKSILLKALPPRPKNKDQSDGPLFE